MTNTFSCAIIWHILAKAMTKTVRMLLLQRVGGWCEPMTWYSIRPIASELETERGRIHITCTSRLSRMPRKGKGSVRIRKEAFFSKAQFEWYRGTDIFPSQSKGCIPALRLFYFLSLFSKEKLRIISRSLCHIFLNLYPHPRIGSWMRKKGTITKWKTN